MSSEYVEPVVNLQAVNKKHKHSAHLNLSKMFSFQTNAST